MIATVVGEVVAIARYPAPDAPSGEMSKVVLHVKPHDGDEVAIGDLYEFHWRRRVAIGDWVAIDHDAGVARSGPRKVNADNFRPTPGEAPCTP